MRTGRRSVGPAELAATLSMLLGTIPAAAQVSPNGPDFQVNTYTTGLQTYSAVGSGPEGGFVVVWSSSGSGGTDQSGSIQLQRFDPHGEKLEPEFQVNSYTTGNQKLPAVAVDPLGRFVVAWASFGSSGSDTSLQSIQMRRFDAQGNPLGPDFQVNTATTSEQYFPGLAVGPQGEFVIVWQSWVSPGTDTSGYSIQARRFGVDGAPLGDQFQVNTYTTDYQTLPSVAIGEQGQFVVAWQSLGSGGNDFSDSSIQARRFDSMGNPLGPEFQVNSYTTYTQYEPSIAFHDAGEFVVTWTSYGSSGTDTSYRSIQAQRFDAAGAPLGSQFQVNTYTYFIQRSSAVAEAEDGGFVVVWASEGSNGTDTSFRSIQMQQFDASGASIGGELQVNTYTYLNQSRPLIAADGLGDLVVAWQSNGSAGTDTSGYSIQARRFDALFRDGFEGGDSGRWSSTLP